MRLREERWRIIRRDGGTVVGRRACDRNFGERRHPDSWLSARSSTWRIAQKPHPDFLEPGPNATVLFYLPAQTTKRLARYSSEYKRLLLRNSDR